MTASIDTTHAARRTTHVQDARAPAAAAEPTHVVVSEERTHVVASDRRPVTDAFGFSRPIEAVKGFAARAAQQLDAVRGAVRASLAALQREGALGHVSAVAALGLAALGFQAQAATPAPLPTLTGVAASGPNGATAGMAANLAVAFKPALDAAQQRPDVLKAMIDTLQARRGIPTQNNVLPPPRDAVEADLAAARAAVAGGDFGAARAHVAAARTAMDKRPTAAQLAATEALCVAETSAPVGEMFGHIAQAKRLAQAGNLNGANAELATALDGATAARLNTRLVDLVGPKGRVFGGEAGELLKAFMTALYTRDLVLAAAIEPALLASLARAPAAAPREAAGVDTGDALLMASAALMILGGVGMMVAGRRKTAAEDDA